MEKLVLEDQMKLVKTENGNMFTTYSVLACNDSDGEQINRLCYYVRIDNIPDPDGTMVFYVVCSLDSGRQLFYRLKSLDSFSFDDINGRAKFASSKRQYRIRALQDSDKSWIVNFNPSEQNTKTGIIK